MATWPTSNGFPQKALYAGYNETREDILLRTQNDIGVENVRKRYSSSRFVISCSYHLNSVQLADWETFWESYTGANYGTNPITMPHPVNDTTITVRIKPATYSIERVSNNLNKLAITLETML